MELDFISDQYSLYHLEHFFCYLVDDVPLSNDGKHQIRLCFYEAVTNAVKHGNQYDATKKVYIRREWGADRLVFFIRDEGAGFDYQIVANRCCTENLDSESGRGIFLLKNYAQVIDYSEETKTLRLEFKWPI